MWFRVPNQIYFNMNAVENLRQFPSRSTIIVTNPALEQMGHVDIVRRHIRPKTHVHVLVIPDAEPEVKVITRAWRRSISTRRTRSSRWAAGR